MDPDSTEGVFTPDLLCRLAQSCNIIDEKPLESLSNDRAVNVLRLTDILITGWGCPAIDREVLAIAPRLKLIAHAAGTVKGFLSLRFSTEGSQLLMLLKQMPFRLRSSRLRPFSSQTSKCFASETSIVRIGAAPERCH